MVKLAKRKLTPIPITQVNVEDRFWSPRMKVNREKTIPHEYKECKDTGRIDAFLLNWKPGMEPKPHYFWDSDVAKWIEAASYSLATNPDPDLDKLLDDVIEKIAGAQQPDGYLNVYFTIVEPQNRFVNLAWWHELYCAGHLIEAAVAHFNATGKRSLLDVMCRYADYIDSLFGPGKRDGCSGHEEIELALVKLYHATGEERYLKLSQFFLDQRGQKPSYFKRELEKLNPDWAKNFNPEYCQDHLPVREQSEVVGHAVRAMYLYSGMADVANETGDQGLLDACERLWNNVCRKRMYITGGIGPSSHNEGFTSDYDLPNETAYAETCAAIGLVFWNHRLLQFQGDSRFADEMERALYNGTISGVSLDGTKFFYVNPMESRGRHHRQDWFGCACCPPNIARLLASFGGYIYSQSDTGIFIHLYVQGSAKLNIAGKQIVLKQKTDYPWDGKININMELESPTRFDLNLRIPGWSRRAILKVNGQLLEVDAIKKLGYAKIEREWKTDDQVELEFPMPVELVEANPAVRQDIGMVALQRGPVVYCLEQVDNPVSLHKISLPENSNLKAQFDANLLGGVSVIKGNAFVFDDSDWDDMLYRSKPTEMKPIDFTAVPYCVWDNREPGEMRVWIRKVGLKMGETESFSVDTKVDPAIYDDYVGRYDYGSAVLAVTKEGNMLFAQLAGQPKFEIFPSSKDKFFWKVVDAQIEFIRDENGKVTHGIHSQGGVKLTVQRLKDEKLAIVDPAIYDSYAGEYKFVMGVLTVTREGDKIFVQVTGQPKVEIFPSSETEFFLKIVNAQIKFVKDENGKVIKAILSQSGVEFEAQKVK